jgi:hypothetical protein
MLKQILWAIAYGKDSGAFGYAFNQESRLKADQVATSNCAQHGDDCKIVINFAHACGAVAAVIGGGIGTGSTQDEAQDIAMSSFRIRAGDSCKVQVWTCSP